MNAGGKKFSFFDGAIGVLHIDRTGTNAFNLRSGERDPGFLGIFDKIVVIGFFVLSGNFDAFFFSRHNAPPFRIITFSFFTVYYFTIRRGKIQEGTAKFLQGYGSFALFKENLKGILRFSDHKPLDFVS